ANQGSCTHPCRWNYALVEEKRLGNHFEIIEHAKKTSPPQKIDDGEITIGFSETRPSSD
ncbi:MAG: U32 family peptidase, partial [Candidatus Hodarchaeota archaeon]